MYHANKGMCRRLDIRGHGLNMSTHVMDLTLHACSHIDSVRIQNLKCFISQIVSRNSDPFSWMVLSRPDLQN
jgi:hypothetical protein